jgi:hypothetical protein
MGQSGGESPFQCIVIDEEQRDKYSAHAMEESVNLDRESLRADRGRVVAAIRQRLGQRWRHGIGDADFFVPEDFESNRFLCLEVANRSMLGEQLLKDIHEVIAEFEADYSVDVCNAWGLLKGDDGSDLMFNALVEKRRVLIYAELEDTLQAFGFGKRPNAGPN